MPAVRPIGGLGSVGLILPTTPQADRPGRSGNTIGSNFGANYGSTEWLTTACREAEAAGAGALWAIDHLFWGRPMLECTTTLAVAATATRRAAVGTCVLQLPLRSPAVVAKQAATLQVLSGGRFVLGVGSGSHRGEYRAAGADRWFPARGRRLDDGIAEVRAAWASGDDPASPYRQEPVPAPVPIWIGGSSPAARRRAARTGDGWVPLFIGPRDLARSVDELRDEALSAGRDPGEVVVAVVVMVAVGDDPAVHRRGVEWLSSLYGIPPKAFDRHLVSGSPDRCADEVGRFADAGAEHVVVMVAGDEAVAQFTRLAEAMGTSKRTGGPSGPGDKAASGPFEKTASERTVRRSRPDELTEVPV